MFNYFILFISIITCSEKVPLDLYVMSKCPDAVKCQRAIVPVIEKIGNIIDLNINYIAQEAPGSIYGSYCMHGDQECLGNIQELCVKRLYPEKHLNFNNCLNENYRAIGLHSGEEQLKKCIAINEINGYNFNICVKHEGIKLLSENLKKSVENKVKTSCTIWINNGESKCVHNGMWQNCDSGHTTEDFVKKICHFYKGLKPKACFE